MEFNAQMIAGLIGGTIVGDPEAKVNNFAKIEEGRPGCISFLYDDKYEQYLYTTESSIVLISENIEPKQEVGATLIKVPDARVAVAKLLQVYESMKPKREGISDLAYIHPSAKIGEKCYIGPFVAIAEGVETAEQYAELKAMGCNIIQGYYFSRPLPADEFEKLIIQTKESFRHVCRHGAGNA